MAGNTDHFAPTWCQAGIATGLLGTLSLPADRLLAPGTRCCARPATRGACEAAGVGVTECGSNLLYGWLAANPQCDLSKRSLQRKLTAQGTRYSRVRDEARFEVAKMLQDPDKNVTEISQLLGYSDATQFSRAFRRIAGATPRIYRQQYRH